MSNRTPPRPAVIQDLADIMLNSLEGAEVEDLTIGEVVSAVFTLANHVTTVLLGDTDSGFLEHNREQLLNAVSNIYSSIDVQKH